jgi:tetratricopeptide (TPR) repeat protein
MDPRRWAAIESLYHKALAMEPGERQAFLATACAEDSTLQSEVESLLAFAGVKMESPAPRADTTEFWERMAGIQSTVGGTAGAGYVAALPSTIGRYRIVRLLGEGGMGTVYEAEQEQPRRTVALKVIKTGLSSPQLVWRFEQEFQALGRLQHPGIAQIHEAGTANTGSGTQPYFAMEFIRGEPLVQYAEAHKLDTLHRLEIMVKVCEAVHHAHQRGIIHRDLKPGNILVDETGQPKILDFGVARPTGSDTPATRQTDMGQLLGTLAYMSPEQVLADPLELDTRTDVYALGVMLFELLAGRLPYQLSHKLHEAVQTIQEKDPAPLSSVNRVYRGDIETIVAKALEKDKTRRYSSAAELAADLQRYLKDEPILARRASAAYQMRKFARRHKALVTGFAAVIAVLIAGIVASTWEAARARRAEQTADAVNDFLQKDVLAQAGATAQVWSGSQPDPDLKVRTALDHAAARIGTRFAAQPLVEASIRQTIGETYRALSRYADAERQFKRAFDLRRRVLGPEHRDSLNVGRDLANSYANQGKFAEAEPIYTRVLATQRRVLGAEHRDTLYTILALANLYSQQARFLEGESLLKNYREFARRVFGENADDTLEGLQLLGEFYGAEGNYAESEACLTEVLKAKSRLFGEENLVTISTMSALAVIYGNGGKYAQAERLSEKVVEGYRRQLGEEHGTSLVSKGTLAWLYQEQGKYGLAESLSAQTLAGLRRMEGVENPFALGAMHRLASIWRDEGKYAEAERLNTEALKIWSRVPGAPVTRTLEAVNDLARTYAEEGNYAQAEALSIKALDGRRQALGADHLVTLSNMHDLALIYEGQGKYAEAEAWSVKALEGRQRVLGPEHPETLTSMDSRALIYQDQGKYAEAEPLLKKTLEARRRVLGAEHPKTLSSMNHLGEVWIQERRYAEAETLLREALASFEKIAPDNWRRYESESLLGASVAGRQNYAAAKTLLVSGYKGMLQRKAAMPAASGRRIEQAGQRIVQLASR